MRLGRAQRDPKTWPVVLAVLSAPQGHGSVVYQRLAGGPVTTARTRAVLIRSHRIDYMQGRAWTHAPPDPYLSAAPYFIQVASAPPPPPQPPAKRPRRTRHTV